MATRRVALTDGILRFRCSRAGKMRVCLIDHKANERACKSRPYVEHMLGACTSVGLKNGGRGDPVGRPDRWHFVLRYSPAGMVRVCLIDHKANVGA